MSDFTTNDKVVPSIERDTPTTLNNAKNTVASNVSAAASAVSNHPITQSVTNGPVADNVKEQHAKTQAEFSNLAASRTTPSTPAATGQPLTHYHSFFYNLLSWEHPRASGIAYLTTVLFIFAARYLDVLRYAFKLTYLVLGVTVLAEVVGKFLFSSGFASQVRPKKYYTVSKETLDSLLGDVHELINFFVIEAQRIVFAENVFASGAAFLAAFISYYLIKIVPFWGLSLISTSLLFLGPLVYKTNQELIDHHLNNASNVINQQTEQVKTIAGQHAARASESTKAFVGDYSAKAQEMIGNARGRSASPNITKSEPTFKKENIPSSTYNAEDFPVAPKQEFKPAPTVGSQINALRDEHEPLIST